MQAEADERRAFRRNQEARQAARILAELESLAKPN